MFDHRSSHAAAAGHSTDLHFEADAGTVVDDGSGPQRALRRLGGLAHQLRATTQAADHFSGLVRDEDRNTGSWLVACAVELAGDLAAELDTMDRALRSGGGAAAAAASTVVRLLRTRAHQLHAAARAADHYLDLDHPADRDTGSWMIACATGLAGKLAADFDDAIGSQRSAAGDGTGLPRVGATATPLRNTP